MIIPTVHEFKCHIEPDDSLTVNVAEPGCVTFSTNEDAVLLTDREQVTLIRDMLTAWLSRP